MKATASDATEVKPILLLDVDGVVFDSNATKQRNIFEVALPIVGQERAEALRRDFVARSGLPREGKIAAILGQDSADYFEVLTRYTARNAETLLDVPFTAGAEAVLEALAGRYRLVALSGADEKELHALFAARGIARLFFAIRGGPLTKLRNLRCFEAEDVVVFVGDARVDVETAQAAGLPFCFMSGYTEWSDWQDRLREDARLGWQPVACIRQLPELLESLPALAPRRLQPLTGRNA